MFRISQPGFHPDIKSKDYFADCCPTPSLTASLAQLILEESPRHVWAAHPRLNPRWEPSEEKKFAMGNAAHAILLKAGKELAVGPFDDWRTKDAQAFRKNSIEGGKVPILAEQYERALEMTVACRDYLASMRDDDNKPLILDWEAKGSLGELCIAWQERGGYWYRRLIDWLPAHCQTVWDYKTTETSAGPDKVGSKLLDGGWLISAAMTERGLHVLHPEGSGRRKHRFVCQQVDYPYCLTVTDLTRDQLTIGGKMLHLAEQLWRACLDRGTGIEHWPGYSTRITTADLPKWAEERWLARELAEEARREQAMQQFKVPSEDLRMGG